MQSPMTFTMLWLVFSLVLSSATFPIAQTNSSRSAPGPVASDVIFAVMKYDEATGVHIEPIVIISGGKYTAPPLDDEAAYKKFVDTYFRTGRQYRVVFGGGDAGSVVVQKEAEPGCSGMLADVTLQTTARLGGNVQALATNSEKIGSIESSRRAPTEEERAAALELARAAYAQRRVGASMIKKMKTLNLTATDLERNGRFDLIGTFQIEGPNYMAYNLFMIIEPSAERYKATLTWYHKGAEADHADRRLVDAVDLDGDGIVEVIAGGHYYESNDYIIYKRQAGQWRQIYQGGGGGC